MAGDKSQTTVAVNAVYPSENFRLLCVKQRLNLALCIFRRHQHKLGDILLNIFRNVSREGENKGNMSAGGITQKREYSIKEISDLFGNTRGAIRFFQERGIIAPRVDGKGIRHYSVDDIFQLIYMKRYASMSFTLKEISDHFRRESETDVSDISDLIRSRIEDLEREQEMIRARLAMMERFSGAMEAAKTNTESVEKCPAFLMLDKNEVGRIAHEEPEIFAQLMELLPQVVVLGTLDCHSSQPDFTQELGIPLKTADEAGLPRSSGMHILPETMALTKVIRVRGTHPHLESDVQHAFIQMEQSLEKQKRTPILKASSLLLFVHTEEGEIREYRKLFLPFGTM